MRNTKAQGGVFLIEALIAILIFSLGILGLVAMGGTAIAAQSDAQYRGDAATFANELAAKIALNARVGGVISLSSFEHQKIVASANDCVFAGPTSNNAIVTDWIERVRGAVAGVPGLPGADLTSESVSVDPLNHNAVVITVCWKPPSTSASPLGSLWHRHTLITYIN